MERDWLLIEKLENSDDLLMFHEVESSLVSDTIHVLLFLPCINSILEATIKSRYGEVLRT